LFAREGGMTGLSPLALHTFFDILAWLCAGAMAYFIARWRPLNFPVAPAMRQSYLAALVFGAGVGAYVFGTLNLWASGQEGLARSIEGALFGGIVGVEGYKRAAGLVARTGARYAAPLAIGVTVGRIGCFLAGLEDFTYGTPTTLPWGHDFGDGITRHPVQLYESAAMAAFLGVYLVALARKSAFIATNGFYLAVLWYGLQRFVWEFLKPYGAVLGPLTVFHLLSLALAIYAIAMLRSEWRLLDRRENAA
jgi:prolipoprotein diacylglyceryltransferase